MDMEFKKEKGPELKIDGIIASGKQFDLDITIPEDNRNVIYGVIKDCYREPVADAVVKLVEIDYECGKKTRKPVSHTFTDKDGEFVFGPLCPNKMYEINFWANKVKHVKVCAKCTHEGDCLKGKNKKCDYFIDCKEHQKTEQKNEYDECNNENGHEKDPIKEQENYPCERKPRC